MSTEPNKEQPNFGPLILIAILYLQIQLLVLGWRSWDCAERVYHIEQKLNITVDDKP